MLPTGNKKAMVQNSGFQLEKEKQFLLCIIRKETRKYTDKKLNKIFLIYREIQSGSVAKSYMRKGFIIYEEMRKYFPIYEEALVIVISLYMRKF
jgi:hypothetical protein